MSENAGILSDWRQKIWEKCLQLMGFFRKNDIFLDNIGHSFETTSTNYSAVGVLFILQKLTSCVKSYFEMIHQR